LYTADLQASFSDLEHARCVYEKCASALLRLGTTTANYFTTIHTGEPQPSQLLCCCKHPKTAYLAFMRIV
jgi:hypothetical protein